MDSVSINKPDSIYENKLRPSEIKSFIGQQEIIKKIEIAVKAAQNRNEPLDHVLLGGSAGYGKTTLAKIIAKMSKSELIDSNAAAIKSPADISRLLCRVKKNNIVFIDEIHALNIRCQEMLYTAMEDFVIQSRDKNGEIFELPIEPFTLIGASTNIGKLSKPTRDRFGINLNLVPYSLDELTEVIKFGANRLNLKIQDSACKNIAGRSRGVPRIAGHLLKRSRDFVSVNNISEVDDKSVNEAMYLEGIDKNGLTKNDYDYLKILIENYGGLSGLQSLATTIRIDPHTVKESIEPFLMINNYIIVTRKGRQITDKGFKFYKKEIKSK